MPAETEVSSNAKKFESTTLKAVREIKNSAKTSISNPVNRLGNMSPLTKTLKEVETPELPMSAEEATKHLNLNDYEKEECKNFDKQIYYAGQNCTTKVKSHPIKYVVQSASMGGSLSERHKKRSSASEKQLPLQVPS